MPSEIDVFEDADSFVFRAGGRSVLRVSSIGLRTVGGIVIGPDLLWLVRLACVVVDLLASTDPPTLEEVRDVLRTWIDQQESGRQARPEA